METSWPGPTSVPPGGSVLSTAPAATSAEIAELTKPTPNPAPAMELTASASNRPVTNGTVGRARPPVRAGRDMNGGHGDDGRDAT